METPAVRCYIPKKLTVGRISDELLKGLIGGGKKLFTNGNVALQTMAGFLGRTGLEEFGRASVLACRNANGNWVNAPNFSSLVGYEPSCSGDCFRDLMKVVSGTVSIIKNVPMSGFIVETGCRYGYDLSSTVSLQSAEMNAGCAFVRDPRGPLVVVNAGELVRGIVDDRLALSQGHLSGTYVWGLVPESGIWASYFRLVETSSELFRQAEKE